MYFSFVNHGFKMFVWIKFDQCSFFEFKFSVIRLILNKNIVKKYNSRQWVQKFPWDVLGFKVFLLLWTHCIHYGDNGELRWDNSLVKTIRTRRHCTYNAITTTRWWWIWRAVTLVEIALTLTQAKVVFTPWACEREFAYINPYTLIVGCT